MLITKKMLIALTLVGALAGAGIGALITHSAQNVRAADDNYANSQTATTTANTPDQQEAARESQFSTSAEQTAYKQGFDEGYNSCVSARNKNGSSSTVANSYATYRTAPVRRYSSSSRRAYYDYSTAPRGRTFWQKHRDKLTVAMGTGAGAILGGLIGGKKGAGIGALAGAGGSALYTYKLRRRARRY